MFTQRRMALLALVALTASHGATTPTLVVLSPGVPADGSTALLQASCMALARLDNVRVVLREPELPGDEIERLVSNLRPLFPREGSLVLHEKCADARRIAAAHGIGLHLSSIADWPAEREAFAGPLGVSAHSEAEVRAAAECGAQWAFLSPVARPTSKPGDMRPPLGEDALIIAQRALPEIDVIALGGISPASAARLAAGGCRGVAVLGGVYSNGAATDPDDAYAAAAAFAKALADHSLC